MYPTTTKPAHKPKYVFPLSISTFSIQFIYPNSLVESTVCFHPGRWRLRGRLYGGGGVIKEFDRSWIGLTDHDQNSLMSLPWRTARGLDASRKHTKWREEGWVGVSPSDDPADMKDPRKGPNHYKTVFKCFLLGPLKYRINKNRRQLHKPQKV